MSGAAALRIEQVDHRLSAVAEQIHAVWMLAYAQEARLLQVQDFAPLRRSVQDLQALDETLFAAWRGGHIVGAVSVGADDEPGQALIGCLIVHPDHQRQGAARALMLQALALCDGQPLAVVTGAHNAPALALYASLGFAPYRRGVLGEQALPVLKLRRLPSPTPAAPHLP